MNNLIPVFFVGMVSFLIIRLVIIDRSTIEPFDMALILSIVLAALTGIIVYYIKNRKK